MSLFSAGDEGARMVMRTDESDPFSSFSNHGFYLDDKDWLTVEHYFQAKKFENDVVQNMICKAKTPTEARKLGGSRWRRPRKNWRDIRRIIMTRAVYIKFKTHADLAQMLLDTGEQTLIENSNYDYYWGCGRDRRGKNTYGLILMDVRNKLKQDAEAV